MAEILFYHLTEKTLEQVLPGLVEKSIGRNWNAVVQAGSPERVEALDSLLWTYRDESFIPHGATRDGFEADQPVWLTVEGDNPNEAAIRFLVDGSEIEDPASYERIVYMFDGHDNSSVDHARTRWKFHKDNADGHELTYWQQTANGGWEKKV